MNEKEREKSQRERECLEKAIKLGINKANKTGEILNYLASGEFVDREQNESPDIVLKCKKGKKNPKTVYVGIEHFIVDQASVKKSNRMVSKGEECNKYIQKAFTSGHNKVLQGEEPSDEDCDKIIEEGFIFSKHLVLGGYTSLIDSLEYGIHRHVDSIETYLTNLNTTSNNSDSIELAFLIEVKHETYALFANHHGQAKDLSNDIFPFTFDMVKTLSKIPSKKVQYVIVVFENYSSKIQKGVFAFRTGNIQKHLEYQGITIYKYFGLSQKDQPFLASYDKPIFENGNYVFNVKPSGNKLNIDSIKSCYFNALSAKQKDIPFIVPRAVQAMLYSTVSQKGFFYDYGITGKSDHSNKNIVQKRLNAFEKVFPTGENDD